MMYDETFRAKVEAKGPDLPPPSPSSAWTPPRSTATNRMFGAQDADLFAEFIDPPCEHCGAQADEAHSADCEVRR
jgi:hypothetical protein